MSRTVREVINFLKTIPEDAIIATGSMWLKDDAEEFADTALTDEQWAKIAYYYDNNEQLGSDSAETITDAVREITNS